MKEDRLGGIQGNTVDKRLCLGKKICVSMKQQRKMEKQAQSCWKETLAAKSKFSKMRMGIRFLSKIATRHLKHHSSPFQSVQVTSFSRISRNNCELLPCDGCNPVLVLLPPLARDKWAQAAWKCTSRKPRLPGYIDHEVM